MAALDLHLGEDIQRLVGAKTGAKANTVISRRPAEELSGGSYPRARRRAAQLWQLRRSEAGKQSQAGK